MNKLFKKVGWVYVPTSLIGTAISLVLLLMFAHDLKFVDHKAHSVSDLYYNFTPYGFMYVATYLWIGKNASQQ